MTGKPRAVAVVRVSAQGDRAEEHFHSPDVQLDSAKRWARKRRERFVAHFGEIDVSGKRPLVKRPGLLKAVEMVEARAGRPHRRGVLRPAGAVAEGAAGGDRAGREGRW